MSAPIPSSHQDYSAALRPLMQRVGICSFRALSRAAGVSLWQVNQLRRGQTGHMRVDGLMKLSRALQVPLTELLTVCATVTELPVSIDSPSPSATDLTADAEVAALKQEYQRLQNQLAQQREVLLQEFQQASLQTLESWMLFWPTAAHKVQEDPEIPAARLLSLIKPVEQLLQQWGVDAIAPVGTEIPYDPQVHQLIEGTAQPGDLVRVRYTGYRQGEKLLYRAKVSPVS